MRLKAPPGSTGFSHGGVSHAVGADGHVDVHPDVAAVLRSHGFTDPDPVPSPAPATDGGDAASGGPQHPADGDDAGSADDPAGAGDPGADDGAGKAARPRGPRAKAK